MQNLTSQPITVGDTVDFDALFKLSSSPQGRLELLEHAALSLQMQQVRLQTQVIAPDNQADCLHRVVSVMSYLLKPESLAELKQKVTQTESDTWTQRQEAFTRIIENVLKQVNSKRQDINAAVSPTAVKT